MALTAPDARQDLLYRKIDQELGSFLYVFLGCQAPSGHPGYQHCVSIFFCFLQEKPYPAVALAVFQKQK
jgi:hypothetical protein